MLKIECPRCKAINENVSADTPCWKCGTILNAPLSSLDDAGYPPSSAANGADRSDSASDPVPDVTAGGADPTASEPLEEEGGEKRYE